MWRRLVGGRGGACGFRGGAYSGACGTGQTRSFLAEVNPAPRLGNTENLIKWYGQRKECRITMRELFEYGRNPNPINRILAAQWLHDEIPLRLAHQVLLLQRLPHNLANIRSIQSVIQLHRESFEQLTKYPRPQTNEEEERFNDMLFGIKTKHNNVQLGVAEGLRELCYHNAAARQHDFSEVLNTFYTARVDMRLLIGHHNALHDPQRVKDGYVGVIKTETSLQKEMNMAVDAATELCMYYYGDAPEVKFDGDQSITFTYIPPHAYYIFFEILKNSMRATAEKHEYADSLPPINVTFSMGKKDVCIRISDKGGGIPSDTLSRIGSYSFSTAQMPVESTQTPMAGYGHGLPFSMLYARHFGGALEVLSMDGLGTDVFVYLSKIGNAGSEDSEATEI